MLLSALLALAACAPPRPPQEPKSPKLEAILALTKDPGFEDEWYHTTSDHKPKIKAVHKAVVGQPIQICVLTVGYALGAKGHTDLRYDVKITKPDGTSYYDRKGLELCVGDGIGAAGVQLAREGLGISFDPPDPRGEYLVRVEIHDEVAHSSASVDAKISLIEFPAAIPFKDADELNEWVWAYPESAEATRVIDAIAAAGEVELLGGAKPDPLVREFLRQLLRANKFLEPVLAERFPRFGHAARLAVLEVVAGTPCDAQPLLLVATDEERKAYEALVQARRPDPLQGPMRDTQQLRETLGIYFATGTYAPIRRLVTALSLDDQAQVGQGPEAMKVVERVARWALGKHLVFPRIRAYCEWMLAHDRLDAKEAEQLKALLAQ
jgi:hypothetical protein